VSSVPLDYTINTTGCKTLRLHSRPVTIRNQMNLHLPHLSRGVNTKFSLNLLQNNYNPFRLCFMWAGQRRQFRLPEFSSFLCRSYSKVSHRLQSSSGCAWWHTPRPHLPLRDPYIGPHRPFDSFTLKMLTAMYAKTLKQLQDTKWRKSKSRSYTLARSCKTPQYGQVHSPPPPPGGATVTYLGYKNQ
jgi:hypothetical protein